MAQAKLVQSSAAWHQTAFASLNRIQPVERPSNALVEGQCSTSYRSGVDFSEATRLNGLRGGRRKDGCFLNLDRPFLEDLHWNGGRSERYQSTWNGKHRMQGLGSASETGSRGRLGLRTNRIRKHLAEGPSLGFVEIGLKTPGLEFKPLRTSSKRGQVSIRFSSATIDRPHFLEQPNGCSAIDEDEFNLSLTSFNILAPIYFRKEEGKRESEQKDMWWERNQKIVAMLEEKHSSIICLQEFWLGNPELSELYTSHLHQAGYDTFKLARTNNRGDGLLTAIDRSKLRVLDQEDIKFRDCGDRVAQLLRVQCKHLTRGGDHPSEVTGDCIIGTEPSCPMEFLLVNTHLLFPHNSNSTLIRLRQVCKILEHLERYKAEQKLPPMPIVLCGDWNGSKRGQVYKFMRSQGFTSSFDTARNFEDEALQRWISHRNHRGNLCGVDFIWLLNPSSQLAPLTADWKAAVFGMIKAKLHKKGLEEREAFHFFQAGGEGKDKDVVTLQDFHAAMDQLGLTGDDSVGLTKDEVEELVASADADGNGVLDYEEFKNILRTRSMHETYELIKRATGIVEEPVTEPPPPPTSDALMQAALSIDDFGPRPKIPLQYMYTSGEPSKPCQRDPPGAEQRLPHLDLIVKDAFLEPQEMENGMWPDDYKLSDHAPVTSIFAPVLRRPLVES